MNAPERSPDPAELLVHAGWLEDLARRLVGAAHAEDLVQDTYAKALQAAPRQESSLRPWLATVLRRLGRDRMRGERNQRDRQHAAARGEALPSSDELVGRAEVQRLVLDAVLALDEPTRRTVLLRHFEGLTAAEIARREGVPGATVRARLARGLAELRATLDRRHGGDGTSWLRAIAAGLGPSAVPSASVGLLTGTIVMKTTLLTVGALTCAIGAAWWFVTSNDAHEPLAMHAVTPVAGSAPTVAMPTATASNPVPAEATTLAERFGAADVNANPGAQELSSISGRWVFSSGAPATGVAWKLAAQAPRGSSWRNLEGTSDAAGRFRIDFNSRNLRSLALEARAEGTATARLTWNVLTPGRSLDVGDVVLEDEAVAVIRIVDEAGRALSDGWIVKLAGPPKVEAASVQVDPATGVARFEGLSAGAFEVWADSSLGERVEGPRTVLQAGETSEVELVLRGSSPADTIAVVLRLADGRGAVFLAAGRLVARGGGVERRSTVPIPSRSLHRFDDLPAGQYTVELDAPGFEPWSAAQVEPGARLRTDLRGTAAIALEVFDAATGAAIEPYTLDIGWLKPDAETNKLAARAPTPWRKANEAPPANGIYAGVPCVPPILRVGADGYRTTTVEEGLLEHGETRRVRIELSRSLKLAGRVVDAFGGPVAGVAVQVTPPGAGPIEKTDLLRRRVQGTASAWQATTSASDGTFAFDELAPGVVAVHAIDGPWLVASRDPVELVAGELQNVVLELPAGARIRGRVAGDRVAEWAANLVLVVRPHAEPAGRDGRRGFESHVLVPIRADGTFVSRALPAGPVQLSVATAGTLLSLPSDVHHSDLVLVEGEVSELELELDLSAYRPGALHVRFADAGDLSAQVVRVDGTEGQHGAGPNEEGVAMLGPLLPGEYELRISSKQGGAHTVPGRIRIAPGEDVVRELDVRVAPGTLRVMDRSSGQPLANGGFTLMPEGRTSYPVKLDERGEVRLELLPGHYRLGFRSDDEMLVWHEITWGTGGPLPATLVIDAQLPR